MQTFFLYIAAGSILLSGTAMAADEATGAPPLAMPSLFKAGAPSPAPAPALPQSTPAGPIKATLEDGTQIEIREDGSVLIVNADGTTTPAPDGVHTLKDGTTFEVKGGKQTGE